MDDKQDSEVAMTPQPLRSFREQLSPWSYRRG